ncbi:MAG: GNAT family N-acetyltransferase, partial [Pseudomonadota bacterium]
GYAHGVGNQQARGYGRFMLEAIEADARQSGSRGLAVWAKDYDAWNPIAFYEHMGFERVVARGLDVLAWKPFDPGARPPALLPARNVEAAPDGKVRLTSINTGWCGGGCQSCVMARDAAAALPEQVVLEEVSGVQAIGGASGGESLDAIYLDSESFRPDGPPYGLDDLLGAIRTRKRG